MLRNNTLRRLRPSTENCGQTAADGDMVTTESL